MNIERIMTIWILTNFLKNYSMISKTYVKISIKQTIVTMNFSMTNSTWNSKTRTRFSSNISIVLTFSSHFWIWMIFWKSINCIALLTNAWITTLIICRKLRIFLVLCEKWKQSFTRKNSRWYQTFAKVEIHKDYQVQNHCIIFSNNQRQSRRHFVHNTNNKR